MPEHFAERHGLIIIIALGESIVAIGAGVTGEITAGIVATAVVGIALAATMWWAYFDVVALAATRRLASIDRPQGAKRNCPRRLLNSPPAHGRRDRPGRARDEEDDRACR